MQKDDVLLITIYLADKVFFEYLSRFLNIFLDGAKQWGLNFKRSELVQEHIQQNVIRMNGV